MNQASMTHHDGFRFRLPSDQVQQIIQAIKQPLPNVSDAMPPPPLPQRLMPTPPLQPVADRTRGESHYSDISMHAGCTSYPNCITEDGDGAILHNGHPTSVVKGRKEGSFSPTKPRDFLSTVLDAPSPTVPPPSVVAPPPTPATMTVAPSTITMSSPAGSGGSASAKKRTRSALRSLTLNEGTGSPEKKERPPRKASKGSGRGRSASRATEASDKENMMIE
ncbi:hypothetical protein KC319_g21662 [Hortaea werneckii]|nr:hypothetical protein KC352_g40957 [Hortaea werneckii]KAI7562711.1 hypothetical protein KC346_g21969 [Hortaea werneckii]KAI7605631.1 hypothetical protein KC319_g21662 [Hortaea werneckii]